MSDLDIRCPFCTGHVTTVPPDGLSCNWCDALWDGEGKLQWSNVAPVRGDFDAPSGT